jgi:hypothetical protein
VIAAGGEMHFVMGDQPGRTWPANKDPVIFSETKTETHFSIAGVAASKKQVRPHELFWVKFSLQHRGTPGTKMVRLLVNGQEYARRHYMVKTDDLLIDSMSCRLYVPGKKQVKIEGANDVVIEVIKTPVPGADQPVIDDLVVKPVIKKGEVQRLSFSIQNIDGMDHVFVVPVMMNGAVVQHKNVTLKPGEKRTVSAVWPMTGTGMQLIVVKDKSARCKVFDNNTASAILDLDLQHTVGDSIVPDRSGFLNSGKVMTTSRAFFSVSHDSILLGKDCYIEVPNSASLDRMDETITMMAWVFPMADDNDLVDLLTKGDNHVLQLAGNKTLGFFAGGWGRGDCIVNLPANWKNNWHHIAGVCNGKQLLVYIDGELKGSTRLEQAAGLSVSNKWIIGRNEEFPLQRVFNGYMKGVKVFAAPLTEAEIREVMVQ